MPTQIQFKRGTAASMAALNLTLAAGEPGLETDTRKVKIGDGTTAWNSLRYATDPLVNSPTAFSADQNNYVLPATSDIFRLSASTPITISGIAAGYDGQKELFVNVGSNAITLAHNSLNSSAGNRFAAPQSENFVLPPNGGIADLTYDAASTVWRINAVTTAQVFDFTRTTAPSTATGSAGVWNWTVPAAAKTVLFQLRGAGAGGGSGRRGAAGSTRFGGGGGGGGAYSEFVVNCAQLTNRALTVTVGAGGAGGAAQTLDDGNGNAGTSGGATHVQYSANSAFIIRVQSAPTGGGGGTNSAGSGGGAGLAGVNGASGGNSSATAAAATGAHTFNTGAPGGGAGGGVSDANVAQNGGLGGRPYFVWQNTDTNGGTAPGGSASALSAGLINVWGMLANGGAGGAGHSSGAGGAGSDGALGSGGGGGGASVNGFNSGVGGNGGDGYVRITVWY